MKRVKSSSKQDGGEGINSRRIIGCREYIYNKYAKQRPSITYEEVGVFFSAPHFPAKRFPFPRWEPV